MALLADISPLSIVDKHEDNNNVKNKRNSRVNIFINRLGQNKVIRFIGSFNKTFK